jgi:GTP-binding protein HflX
VHNKMDLLPTDAVDDDDAAITSIPCSALTGEGIDALCALLDARLKSHRHQTLDIQLPAEAGEARAWIFRHGEVLEDRISEDDGSQHIHARLPRANYDKFFQLYGDVLGSSAE